MGNRADPSDVGTAILVLAVSYHKIRQPVTYLDGGFVAAEVWGDEILVDGGFDRGAQGLRFRVPAQKFEHHGRCQDRAQRIGDALPGDVWGGAVDRLEERGAAGMDVARRREAQAAG